MSTISVRDFLRELITNKTASWVKGQDRFQPGATPIKDKRRYLAFNMIGTIHTVERDSHNIVTVDFHDQSRQASSHFDDFSKFSLGCLGHQGAAYAANSTESGNTIAFRPFDSWGSPATGWSADLASDESVTALAIGGSVRPEGGLSEDDPSSLEYAAGTGVVVAATSKGYLRFFSGGGSQTYLMNFGEEIVALSANKEWLFVVHRSSELVQPGETSLAFLAGCSRVIAGHQTLSYTMLDLETFEIVQNGSIPLSKNSTLTWIGFAETEVRCRAAGSECS